MRAPFICSLLAAAALSACAVPLPTETSDVRDVGYIIGLQQDDPQLSVPDSARAGSPFIVTVRTYGNSCVVRHSTQLAQSASTATVTPFDMMQARDHCPGVLRTIEHSASVRFDAPGRARVVFRGRHMPTGYLVTFEREVHIRPAGQAEQ